MQVKDLSEKIDGLKQIIPEVFYDFRGQYMESFNTKDYNFGINFVQDDFSFSRKNVFRGLHGDNNTWKLISCVYGEIYFIVYDHRTDSKTHKNIFTITLNDKNRFQILVPAGCANGHLCLSENCIFHYKQSTYYWEQKQFTISYKDLTRSYLNAFTYTLVKRPGTTDNNDCLPVPLYMPNVEIILSERDLSTKL